ncbi:hypothetical protein SVIOM74S_03646 [Streptomyces violarus]
MTSAISRRTSRAADQSVTVIDRILSARGLDHAVRALRRAEAAMADGTERSMNAYVRAEAEFQSRGGYAAEAEAARVAAGVGLASGLMDRPLSALSGGQRRRVELARILFAGHGTLLLDEPTNHLDADSVAWLRGFLTSHQGGLVMISHDTSLLAGTVNRVFHLDPGRAALDVHNTGWDEYLAQRDADERRRTRERANAERKAAALHAQADKMRARVAGPQWPRGTWPAAPTGCSRTSNRPGAPRRRPGSGCPSRHPVAGSRSAPSA